MATTRTVYVDTDGGGDYTSLKTALSSEAKNLVSADEITKFICSGTTADSGGNALIETGWTTSESNYIWIYCDPMGTAGRHPGYYSASHYRIESAADSGILRCRKHVIVDGIQVKNTATAGEPSVGIVSDETTATVIVRNCIAWKSGDSTASGHECIGIGARRNYYGAFKFVAYNNIIFGDWEDGLYMYAEPGQNDTGFFYNNTVVNALDYGFWWDRDLGGSGSVVYLKNNILDSAGTADYSDNSGSTGTLTSATNITSDATSPDGASYQSITMTYANAGSNDFRLSASDTDAIAAGTDLSAVGAAQYQFSTDNQERTIGTCDIGGDNYQAPGTTRSVAGSITVEDAGTVSGSTG